MRRWWVLAPLALIAVTICGVFGYATRFSLNPDGVSYLDLSLRLRAGDLAHFIQGYWSPLYPTVLAIIGAVSGASQARMVELAHGFDTLLSIATIALICWLGWRLKNLAFALVGLPLFILASGRLPRLEAITPDVLLAFILALLAAEILLHGARRWLYLGILFGLTFLTKNSSWPWLIAAFTVTMIGAPTSAVRRLVIRSAAVCTAIIMCWLVPLSVAYGRPTIGSAGRLNYHWYVENADTRMPETHSGNHRRYKEVAIDSSLTVTVAIYDREPWTYQPWGDPTAWDAGLVGGYTVGMQLPWFSRAMTDFGPMIQIWTFSVTVMVLLPLLLMTYRRGLFGYLYREDRRAGLLIALGFLGIGQFLAVHAEPRLIAPFVLMGGLGVVHWWTTGGRQRFTEDAGWRPLLLSVGLGYLWAAGMATNFVNREFALEKDDISRNAANLSHTLEIAPNVPHPSIVLVGKAGETMGDVWRVNGRVIAQVIRPTTTAMDQWTKEQKESLLAILGNLNPDLIWVVLPEGGLAMIPGK